MLQDEQIQEIARAHYMPTGNEMLDFARAVIAAAGADQSAEIDCVNSSPAPEVIHSTAPRLRAMANYFGSGHQWDNNDAKACKAAAFEIDHLRTRLLSEISQASAAVKMHDAIEFLLTTTMPCSPQQKECWPILRESISKENPKK